MSDEPMKIFKGAGFLIPVKYVSQEEIQAAHELFTFRFYNEKGCERCDVFKDGERHSEEQCDSCPQFKGAVQLSKVIEAKDKNGKLKAALSLPRGSTAKVRKWTRRFSREFEVLDSQPKVEDRKFSRPIKMTATLKEFQREARDLFLDRKRGIVEAAPRSGKTVLGASVICAIGAKTLILAHQREWLENFAETFLGSATQEKMTTAKNFQVRFCSSYQDFMQTDVCMATFQQFMNPSGRKLLERLRSMFVTVVIDEAHKANALQSSRVLSVLNARYVLALSATPERKDGRDIVMENLVGSVIYKAKVERLRPRVKALWTPYKFKLPYRGTGAFTLLQTKMESHQDRRDLIVKTVVQLAKEGHFVFVPLTRVKSVNTYVRLINEEAEDKIARGFLGGMKKEARKQMIEDARQYKFKVMVGNSSLISTGINIPRASAIIERITLTSNIPTAVQRMSRILTPWEDKPDPLIVLVLDDGEKEVVSATRNEYYNGLVALFNPIIDQLTQAKINDYFKPGKVSTGFSRADF